MSHCYRASTTRLLRLALPGLLIAFAAAGAAGRADAGKMGLPPGIVQVGAEYLCQKDNMPMLMVPAGEFTMGSDTGSYDERPAHRVYLDPFLIDKHEVTNAQFEQFLKSSGYKAQGPWKQGFGPGGANLPVRFVTWFDASAYARWVGRQLPSEAQWEKSARGSASLKYPWGMEWKEGLARIGTEVAAGPLPAGSFSSGASPYGCLDMAGNVWEWVDDWYDRYYYESLKGVSKNPTGPSDHAPPEERFYKTKTESGNERSTRKVIRGGGWASTRDDARCARRIWGNPSYWLDDTGFRLALKLGKLS